MNGNGEYVKETTTEGHQWVFNAAETPAAIGMLHNGRHIKIRNTHETKIKNHTRLSKARGT